MKQLYLNDCLSSAKEDLRPRKETIDFLLNYSKSLKINSCKKLLFEMNLN